MGRLTGQTDGAGKVLGFSYDLKGQLTSIAYPNSVGSVARTYDDAGRLKTILDWLSPGSRTPFTYTYDANSNVTNLAYPNGDSAAMTYNHADQMTQKTDVASSVTILSLGYTPDSIGLTTAEAAKTYSYDTINRVKTSTDNGGSTYTYDNADRLTQLALTGANTTTNVYNNADEITSLTIKDHSNVQVQQYTYAYDNNGNRTQQTDQSSNHTNYGYDQVNRMTSFSGGGHSATYAYNGDGLRQSKTVDSVTTSDVWMPVGQGLPVIVVDKIGTTTAYYVTGAGGAPLEQITGTTPYYFHSNMLGSTRKVTDAAGAVQQSYDYDPYGNPITATGSVVNPFQFAAQYLDAEGGLYYLRARYYASTSSQFSTRDPAVELTRTSYQYATGSPVSLRDPSGLWVQGIVNPDAGGIYSFFDQKAGLPYIGQSGNIAMRLAQHVRTGRLASLTDPSIQVEECGGGSQLQRELAEHNAIIAKGGIKSETSDGLTVRNLANKRYPIGDARKYLLDGFNSGASGSSSEPAYGGGSEGGGGARGMFS